MSWDKEEYRYLVDTTVLVDHLRGREWASRILKREDVVISYVTVAELIKGVRNKEELRVVLEWVMSFRVLWGGEDSNQLAVYLLKKYRLRSGFGFLDALIASIAILDGLVLVTDNVKHFKRIAGLEVIRPRQLLKESQQGQK